MSRCSASRCRMVSSNIGFSLAEPAPRATAGPQETDLVNRVHDAQLGWTAVKRLHILLDVPFRDRLVATIRAARPIVELPEILIIGSEVPNLLQPGAAATLVVSLDLDIGVPVRSHAAVREKLAELVEFSASADEPSVWIPHSPHLLEVNFVGMDPDQDPADAYMFGGCPASLTGLRRVVARASGADHRGRGHSRTPAPASRPPPREAGDRSHGREGGAGSTGRARPVDGHEPRRSQGVGHDLSTPEARASPHRAVESDPPVPDRAEGGHA